MATTIKIKRNSSSTYPYSGPSSLQFGELAVCSGESTNDFRGTALYVGDYGGANCSVIPAFADLGELTSTGFSNEDRYDYGYGNPVCFHTDTFSGTYSSSSGNVHEIRDFMNPDELLSIYNLSWYIAFGKGTTIYALQVAGY